MLNLFQHLSLVPSFGFIIFSYYDTYHNGKFTIERKAIGSSNSRIETLDCYLEFIHFSDHVYGYSVCVACRPNGCRVYIS